MSSLNEISPVIFQLPACALLVGPTMSGKSNFLVKLLTHTPSLMYPIPTRIVYCSSTPPEANVKNIKNIEFVIGLPDTSIFNPLETNLIVLDDLAFQSEQSNEIMQIFTVKAHHLNLSTFMLVHNLFGQNKFSRTISLNSNYLVLFKNPRDRTQLEVLGRQIFPKNPKFLMEAFEDATKTPFSHMLLDLTQKTEDKFRVQSNIFTNRIIYQPL
jgi:hypothetical protein